MDTTQLKVRLIPAAVGALAAEKAASKMRDADVTNRALQLYNFLMEQERQGAEICVRPKRGWSRPLTTIEIESVINV